MITLNPLSSRHSEQDREVLHNYWQQKGMPWRTEPEINKKRQKFLIKRLALTSDLRRGIYPFKSIKLNRADIEWLLASHDNGQGPVMWLDTQQHQRKGLDTQQHQRKGLDLRGADLQRIDLHGLPLACVRFGLTEDEWFTVYQGQWRNAAADLRGTNLSEAHLEGADLSGAHLEGADLSEAHLEDADLFGAYLDGTFFHKAHLSRTNLRGATLKKAKINKTDIQGALLDEDIIKEIGEGRSIILPNSKITENSQLPLLPFSFPSKKFFSLLSSPLMLLIIGALLTNLLLPRITQSWQDHQRTLDIKTSLITKMSEIIANSFTELELIQSDSENNNLDTALANFYSAFRNMRTNGEEIEAQIAAYFPNEHPCMDLHKIQRVQGKYELLPAWSNYYRILMVNIFYLSTDSDVNNRAIDVDNIRPIFNEYLMDSYSFPGSNGPVNWDELVHDFSFIDKYKNYQSLVTMENVNWSNLELAVENFRFPLEQCVLKSDLVLS